MAPEFERHHELTNYQCVLEERASTCMRPLRFMMLWQTAPVKNELLNNVSNQANEFVELGAYYLLLSPRDT